MVHYWLELDFSRAIKNSVLPSDGQNIYWSLSHWLLLYMSHFKVLNCIVSVLNDIVVDSTASPRNMKKMFRKKKNQSRTLAANDQMTIDCIYDIKTIAIERESKILRRTCAVNSFRTYFIGMIRLLIYTLADNSYIKEKLKQKKNKTKKRNTNSNMYLCIVKYV